MLGWALGLTSTFLVAEVVAGLFFNSLALLSDAAHMMTDVAALAIALMALKVGSRPADERRTYGYKRLEVLAAAFNAVMLFAVAIYVLVEAIGRLRKQEQGVVAHRNFGAGGYGHQALICRLVEHFVALGAYDVDAFVSAHGDVGHHHVLIGAIPDGEVRGVRPLIFRPLDGHLFQGDDAGRVDASVIRSADVARWHEGEGDEAYHAEHAILHLNFVEIAARPTLNSPILNLGDGRWFERRSKSRPISADVGTG
ncbi:cation diffusion facilitator family transporter [Rhizobium leguminosarum]|uniref:cation diffusion facilitator family transporter n=1 Tax=Rhizobium leguminosarum TaxID=384 RepID=UPI0028F41841|nr:cation diffusion facilitator family transporter [Rhizobium leguminosarum]